MFYRNGAKFFYPTFMHQFPAKTIESGSPSLALSGSGRLVPYHYCKPADDKGNNEHNYKGDEITGRVDHKGETWRHKKEIKRKNTEQRSKTGRYFTGTGRDEHRTQQIHHCEVSHRNIREH